MHLDHMPGLQVPVQVPPPHQDLPAQVAPVLKKLNLNPETPPTYYLLIRSVPLGVQPDVLVQIAGIAEGPHAELALQGLVPRVRPDVDLQAVLPRVALSAVETNVSLLGLPQAADQGLDVGLVVVPALLQMEVVLFERRQRPHLHVFHNRPQQALLLHLPERLESRTFAAVRSVDLSWAAFLSRLGPSGD
jgi:hypothetical protein